MRITTQQVSHVQAGYIMTVDVLGVDAPEYYVSGDRQGYAGQMAELTSRPDVLQVHSARLEPAYLHGKSVPTPIIAEDFGTMAGFLWSGDEFALDGRGEDE